MRYLGGSETHVSRNKLYIERWETRLFASGGQCRRNMSNQNIVLKTVLECGTADLSILDDIGYDLGEIIEEMLFEDIKPTLNNITSEVFEKGVSELEDLVKARIEDLEGNDKETLAALQSLEPRADINWYCNCLDTHIFFTSHEEIYREYLPKEIAQVEENMGFSF